MVDNEQHFAVQVIPGTPPPSSSLTLQIPDLTIQHQEVSPSWSESNDSFGYDLAFPGPDDYAQFPNLEDISAFNTSTSSLYLSPHSPASSSSFSPVLSAFKDFTIASSSGGSSPLIPYSSLDGSESALPFSGYEFYGTYKNNEFLSPDTLAPSPQHSFPHSPGSSFSELGPDIEQNSTANLVRRHSHGHGHSISYDFNLPRSPNPQLPLRRTRSISVVRSRSPYGRPETQESLLMVPSPSRSPAPPFPEPEIPNYSPEISITTPSDESDETTVSLTSAQRETIASPAVLRASEKRRTKRAAFQCDICGNYLTSKDNLNNHIDAHKNIRRHQCDNCGERFRTRSVLKRHQSSNKCKSRVNAGNSYVGKLHC